MNTHHKYSLVLLWVLLGLKAYSQCSSIGANGSDQYPNSPCSPVEFRMDVNYTFFTKVTNPSLVEVRYEWNDPASTVTTVPAITADSINFSQSQTLIYPPGNTCSYTAEAFIVYDGEICESTSRQEQTFSTWARDNENNGVLTTDPVNAYFCENEEIVAVTFDDNSTFNCNLTVEPDRPNRLTRWVQFVYNTAATGGSRIPNVSIESPSSMVYQMTDATGSPLDTLSGPIIEVPIPADAPNQTSWEISAPPGGQNGDIFEITMRNWNTCNPYDNTPFDGNPPADSINGDNPPIITRAYIIIQESPSILPDPSPIFCAGESIILTVNDNGGTLNWYSDSLQTTPIGSGNNFNPASAPYNLNNNAPGNYTLWVTESNANCTSPASKITFSIIEQPSTAQAGNDSVLCASQLNLYGNNPSTGSGVWTTNGNAVITDPTTFNTLVTQLDTGINDFIWTITNSICVATDVVTITRDIQPTPAQAGTDTALCDISSYTLQANSPDNNGTSAWTILTGGGSLSAISNPNATINNMSAGLNTLLWEINSLYNACTPSTDSIVILYDQSPGTANAGANVQQCETDTITLQANTPLNNGTGTWSVITPGPMLTAINNPNAIVQDLQYEQNLLSWTLASVYGHCPTSTDTLQIERLHMPDQANAGADIMLCDVLTTPLNGNAASEGIAQWIVFEKPTANTPVFSPNKQTPNATLSIAAGDEGIYGLSWTIQNGPCISSDTVYVHFGQSPPPAITSNDDTICGTNITISANLPANTTGLWDIINSPGAPLFNNNASQANNTLSIAPGAEGLYQLRWTLSSGSCTPQTDTLTLLFIAIPETPSVQNDSACVPANLVLKANAGAYADTVRWYNNTMNYLGSPDSIFLASQTTDTAFFASSYNTLFGCESTPVQANGKIFEVPDIPLPQHFASCGDTMYALALPLPANANTFKWYTTANPDSLITVSDTFIYNSLQNNNIWYSAYNSVTGCESNSQTISFDVYNLPQTPLVNDVQRCDSGFVSFHATADSLTSVIEWYTNAALTSLIDTGTIFTTPYLPQTKSYWVKGINSATNCESTASEIKAIINPIPAPPFTKDTMRCGTGSITLEATPGINANDIFWYTSFTDSLPVANSELLITGPLSLGGHTYWASSIDTATGCQSDKSRADVSIYPNPLINNIIGYEEVTLNQENVLYSSGLRSGSSYQWIIPNGIDSVLTSDNYSIVRFPQEGNFELQMIETNQYGCVGPVNNKYIQVIDKDFEVNPGTKYTETCLNADISLSSTPTGGTPTYTFRWSGDTTFLDATNIANPTFTAQAVGNYTLYVDVTDLNLNTTRDTVLIRVNPNPEITFTIADTIICVGSSESISTATTGGSGSYVSYNWTGYTASLNTLNSPSPIFNSPVHGTFPLHVEVTDSKGCKANNSVVIFNEQPTTAFEIQNTDACSPAQYSFNNQSDNAIRYEWDFGDGHQSAQINAGHNFFNTGNSVEYFTVKLTAYSENNCQASQEQTVYVYPNPPNTINTDPPVACDPADILLFANPGGMLYHWHFGDSTSQTGDYNIKHRYTNPTNNDASYHVQLVTTTYFGCFDTSYSTIIVHPSPVANFILDNYELQYPDNTIGISNHTADKNWTYAWDYDDGTFSTLQHPETHTFENPGAFDIQLKVSGEFCADSIKKRLVIKPAPPIARFKSVDPGCQPLTVAFENQSLFADEYEWDFGDGNTSSKQNPTYTYFTFGNYTIRLTVRGQGGIDMTSDSTSVYIVPKAGFDIAPRNVYANDTRRPVRCFNLTTNADAYEWDFGDGNQSYEKEPIHVYQEAGTYTISLTVWTENNCYDYYEIKNAIEVEPVGDVIYPNAFRPDAGGINSRFEPAIIDDVDNYHLMIFNRWGELIFESFDINTGWDGKINGHTNAKQDVYVWKVTGTYNNGQPFEKTGDVTLLR